MRTLFSILALAGMCTSACSGWDGPRPADVPTQVMLAPQASPVLQVTFRATAQGYAITRMRQVMGAPTLAINQDRAVLLVAADPNGSVVASVSVPNPRVVHTAGSRDPATAVLDEATFTVNFPDPQAIRSIDVTVREGPNAAYKQRFPVQDYPRPATQ